MFIASIGVYAQIWTPLTSGSTSTLFSIDFPTQNVGYTSGSNGTILKTINEGTTWQSLTSSYPGYFFWDIHFVNADTGFVCGESNPGTEPAGLGIILKTTNGGISWTVCMSGAAGPFRDLFVLNQDTVFVCGGAELRYSKIYKSVDGGTNWTEIGTSTFDRFIGGMYFLNSQKGFLGDYESGMGTVHPFEAEWLNTTDGGASFTSNVIPSSTGYWEFSTDFPDQTTGYSTRSKYSNAIVYLRKTTDGGSNWTENAISSFTGYIYCLDFIDANTGYIVGGAGTIKKSNDGGSSWISETSGTTQDLHSITFTSTTGFAVGGNGTIIKTDLTTGIADTKNINTVFESYPNPFSGSTTINYSISKEEAVELTVVDVLGKKIAIIESSKKSAGKHSAIWNAETVAEGMYILQLKVDNQILTKKIIITKK